MAKGRVGVKSSAAIADTGNVRAINENDPAPVTIKVTLPAELYAQYEALASGQGVTVAEILVHRLTRCVDHSSIRSLYFSESQLRQLEQVLMTRPLDDPQKAIASIASWFKVRINEFEPVPISAQQARRVHLGAYSGTTPQEHLHRIVIGAVAKATGV